MRKYFKPLAVILISIMLVGGAVKAIDMTLTVGELQELAGQEQTPGGNFGAISTRDYFDSVGGYYVDGTAVVNSSKGISAVAGTFSSTLGVTGATTLSGAVTLKEAAATISTTTSVTAAQSGTTFYVTGATTGATVTLPAATAGLIYRFVIGGAFGTNNVIIDSAEGDNVEGTLIVAGAVVDCDAEDQINFIADGENIGDYVELRSDGTQWLIGSSGALTGAKLTCTDPS